MGLYMHVHGYAMKVQLNVLHFFCGPKLFTEHKIKIQIKQSSETIKYANIPI